MRVEKKKDLPLPGFDGKGERTPIMVIAKGGDEGLGEGRRLHLTKEGLWMFSYFPFPSADVQKSIEARRDINYTTVLFEGRLIYRGIVGDLLQISTTSSREKRQGKRERQRERQKGRRERKRKKRERREKESS